MVGGIARIFTHRAAGPLWCGVSVVLAGALVVTGLEGRRDEEFLRGRIAALASHDASQLQGELVSCRATVRSYAAAMSASSPRPEAVPGQATKVTATPGQVAAELAANPPAGFDVCARMESADQAVMKTLDRR
jgi:hypothetical protein